MSESDLFGSDLSVKQTRRFSLISVLEIVNIGDSGSGLAVYSVRFAGLRDSFLILMVQKTLCQFILSFLQGQKSQSLGSSSCLSVSIRALPFLEWSGSVCCFAVPTIWMKNKLYSESVGIYMLTIVAQPIGTIASLPSPSNGHWLCSRN